MSSLGLTPLEGPLVFVDIETNGLSHIRGRVIEVAAIRVEAGKIVQSFSSLVNPEAELPHFITNLTGITSQQVRSAPTFGQIADELQQVLSGAVFVAHNVRFDYSFLKQEFTRLGRQFLPKQLCTVKLSRKLYPHEKGHKLQDLIQRHDFTFTNRHRAYDDAAVLWQFIQHVTKYFPPEQVTTAVAAQLKQPALPKQLEPALVRNLPQTPGVYIFEDDAGRPLYIGKSVNIKQRVIGHFGRDHADQKEFKISQNIAHINTRQTTGELSALLLEAQLVKQLQPLYNRRLRKLDKLLLLKQAELDGYINTYLEEASEVTVAEFRDVLAIYPRRMKACRALEDLQRTFNLCPKLLGLEKSPGACFLYQLRKCRGACVGQESAYSYNARLKIAFERQRIQTWPYSGAVLIEEASPASMIQQGIIVDQWCVLGEVKQEADCDPIIKRHNQGFDLDTYKILQSFLTTTKAKSLRIKRLTQEQSQAFIA